MRVLFLAAILFAGAAVAIAAEDASATKTEAAPAAEAKLFDPEKAKSVAVVLRVELLKAASAVEKYGYDQVKVLEVYKNDPGAKFPKEVTIAFRNTDTGVPPGVSTVYLVDYHTPPEGKMWRLVTKSHNEKK
ncbi:MAG: hypothetical protein NTW87_00270 [Planctomycetota bacterium]|nr:hypothetical protein [Planctomycetota bacterium]